MSGASPIRGPVCVLGGGSWGTALARHMALRGHPVRLWVHDPSLAAEISATRRNGTYLPGFEIPAGVDVSSEPDRALSGAGLLLVVVPTRHGRAVLTQSAPFVPPGAPVVVASKGIERGSLLTVSGLAAEILGRDPGGELAVLSGPSFALEVAAGSPTAVVAASKRKALALSVQSLLAAPGFRVYTSADPVGVELGGALKNVIALASGIVAGAGLGANTVAALITRGLAEISRLAVALGGARETLAGLAGLGDLVLTCTGTLSRNRQVGLAVGRGAPLGEVIAGMKMVAEGVDTCRSALDLGRREGISLPITEKVNEVLFEGKSPAEGIAELMDRPPRPESD